MAEKYTSPKGSAIRQLNDELEQGILRSVENNPLVALGLDRVGVEQMSTLFDRPLESVKFNPAGFSKERLRKLGHVGGSPVDFDKPSVLLSIENMARRGPALTRSDLAHEYGHAGIAALANFKPHNIGRSAEEAIMRHQDIQMGGPEAAAESQEYVDDKYVDPKGAMRRSKDYHKQLSDKAAKRLYDEGKRSTSKTRASEIASKSEYTDAVKTVKSAGRFGDTEIMHVSPLEVAWMHENSPTGLTINPETGQPEAFLPLLGAFLGSTFAAELGLVALMGGSAIGGSMLGAGLGSFGGSLAQGDDWKRALAGGALAAGTTGLFQGIMGAGEGAIGEEAISAAMPGTTNLTNFTGPGSGIPSSYYGSDVGGVVSLGGSSGVPSGELAGLFKTPFIAGTGPGQAFSPASFAMNNPGAAARAASAAVEKAGMWGAFKEGLGAFDFASPEGLSAIGLAGAGWAGDGLSTITGTPQQADIPDFTKDRANRPEQFPVLRTRLTPPEGYRHGEREEFQFFNPTRRSRFAAQGGLVKKYQAGGEIRTPPPGYRHGFQPEFDFFGGARGRIPVPVPTIPGHTPTVAPSSPKLLPPVSDGDGGDIVEIGGRSDVGLDEARSTSAFVNSPFGRIAAAVVPGGIPISGALNLAANKTVADALGVDVANNPFMPSAAMDAVNTTDLKTAEFDTPPSMSSAFDMSNVPSTQGINLRAHDPRGSPRNERDAVLANLFSYRGDARFNPYQAPPTLTPTQEAVLGIPRTPIAPERNLWGQLPEVVSTVGKENEDGLVPYLYNDALDHIYGAGVDATTLSDTDATYGGPSFAQGGLIGFANGGRIDPRHLQFNVGAEGPLNVGDQMVMNNASGFNRLGAAQMRPNAMGLDAMMPGASAGLGAFRGPAPLPPILSQERSIRRGYAEGGPVNKYQAGGIMQGLDAGTPPPRPVQAQPQQNPVVMGAIAAIMGNHPEPQRAIQNFVQVYGQQAFTALRQQVIAQASVDQRGGAGVASLIQGEGDGLSDDVPANIEGQEPVALSDGEVVVPADVVSGLGNGSSEAGAREIEKMNQDVRQVRTGTRNQPEAINTETMLPGLR
jgi:hypothetical protein